MKKTVITLAVIGSIAGLGLVNAQRASAFGFGPHDGTFVSKLAQKLGISEDTLNNALSQLRSEQQTERETALITRLDGLVKEGKITEAQKQLILDKHAELKSAREAQREEFKNLSMQERQAKLEQQRQDLEAWAQNNGIDLKLVLGEFAPFGRFGGHRPFNK